MLHWLLIPPRVLDQIRRGHEAAIAVGQKLEARCGAIDNHDRRIAWLEQEVEQLRNQGEFRQRVRATLGQRLEDDD